jgi:hypothetical protein
MTPLTDQAYCQGNQFLASVSSQELDSLLEASSALIRKYCRRNFTQQAYTRYIAGPQTPYDILMLPDPPIQQITRLATNPTVVLQISNNNTAYQRATVATTATGIVLFTVASGVQATNASITYALYPTVQAVANAINALNLGWTATPVQGYALYPSADFKIIQGAMTADQNNGGAGLEMYLESSVFGGYGYYSWGQPGAWTGSTLWRFDKEKSVIYGSLPPSQDGNPNIRVDYVGGFNPIPDDVQRACLLVAVSLWGAGRINPFLKSESALDYSYTNNNESKAIPPAAREILAGYVDSAARYCNWS